MKTESNTRVEFAMENEKLSKLICSKCKEVANFWVNQLYAKESKSLAVFAGLVFIIGTAIGLYFVRNMIPIPNVNLGIYASAMSLLISVWIYIILKKEDRSRVTTCNHAYVKESYE